MGFQFNHVGQGTKTRRPVTLHMRYNPACQQPLCALQLEERGEVPMPLEEIQGYIEKENAALDRQGQYSPKEIQVKIQYKHCPNLTIIDMPGLISHAPGRKHSDLATQSAQVDAMVREKLTGKEYIILCLEDCPDWGHATTRKVVMQVDPSLSRTVLVATKLDTKIPQFARAQDVDMFLRPSPQAVEPGMLGGGPFFTSVPSGRVGVGRDMVFKSNEHFRSAIVAREQEDIAELEQRLLRKMDKATKSHVGVSQLRRFLEHLLQRRYVEGLPRMLAMLDSEQRSAGARLERCTGDLGDLAADRLKDKGRKMREGFIKQLGVLVKGTIAAAPDRFGETLETERQHGGSFQLPDGTPLAPEADIPYADLRLYGGAQYCRAISEFRECVGHLACPTILKEEIVNACGLDEYHSAVNYMRTACIIAVSKARETLEPFVGQLGARLSYVMRRMLPIALHLLHKDPSGPGTSPQHDLFFKRIGAAYCAFVEETEGVCRAKCMEDLDAVTRFVTWSLHDRKPQELARTLQRVGNLGVSPGNGRNGKDASSPGQGSIVADVLQALGGNRQLGAAYEEIITALVHYVYEGIRDFTLQCLELKFNCFFLIPITEAFPTRVREELETAYEIDLDQVFDVQTMRAQLQAKQRSLEREYAQVQKLTAKFHTVHNTLLEVDGHLGGPLPPSGADASLREAGAGADVKASHSIHSRPTSIQPSEIDAEVA